MIVRISNNIRNTYPRLIKASIHEGGGVNPFQKSLPSNKFVLGAGQKTFFLFKKRAAPKLFLSGFSKNTLYYHY